MGQFRSSVAPVAPSTFPHNLDTQAGGEPPEEPDMRLYAIPFILLLSSLSGLAQTGSVSGSVLDDAGKAKPGVWVTAVRTTVPPARATAATNQNGAFLLPGLPPGAYRICAQVPGGGYLDPCEWSDYTTAVRG